MSQYDIEFGNFKIKLKLFNMKNIIFLLMLLLPTVAFAQGGDIADQFGNFLRESGKLYVVFAVIIVIFAGIITMLIRQELKLNHLEKRINSKN